MEEVREGAAGDSTDAAALQVSQDDVFSEAFDLAQAEGEKADLSVADDPKNQKDETPPPPKEEATESQPEDTNAEGEAKEPPAAATKATEEPPKAGVEDDPAKIEQKYKTLQGIHKHDKETWEQERSRLLAELEEAKKPKTPEEKKSTEKETSVEDTFEDNLTPEQKAELDQYDEAFDMVSKMEGLKREKALKKLRMDLQKDIQKWKEEITSQITATKTDLAPAIQLAEEAKVEAHFNAIKDGYSLPDGTKVPGHSDYEKYVDDGSLKAWIETKPAYIRRGMERVYASGSVQDAIDLLSDFKRENNISESQDATSDNVVDLGSRKEAKKAALAAVHTRKTAVAAGRSIANDFDGAFDEALSKTGG